MSASTRAPLAVVTVAYNSADVLPGFLNSLAAGLEGAGPWEVVVADNASSDGSAALAAAHPSRPRVVETGRNGGYAAGINAALQTVSPDADILIFNPDIRLHAGVALRLRKALEDPTVGIAVPRIVDEEGNTILSLRREPSVVTAWSDAVLGGGLGGRLRSGEIVTDRESYENLGTVDWANGAALAVSARARAKVGPWDESFFLYSEETEYCRRVREAGFSITYVPDASVHHIGGEYLESPRLYAILTANRVRYFRRYHGHLAALAFQSGVAAGEALRALKFRRHRIGLISALLPMRMPA